MGQAQSSVTPSDPRPPIDLPRRLTLPFSPYSKRDSEVSGRQAHSNGLLSRTRLISDPYVEGHRPPPMSASILPEDIGNADTSPFATMDLISALDTAIMVAARPRTSDLRLPNMLAYTYIEDFTQRVTLTLPAIPRDAEQVEQGDQSKDITTTARGAGIAGLGSFLSGALRYVTYIAMAHMVSPAIYGAFGEVYTAVYLFGALANLGLSGIVTYLLPTYRVKDERGLVRGLVSFSTRITLITGSLLGALLFACAAIIAQVFYHEPSYELILRELAPLIPLIALVQVFVGGLQAFKEIKWKVSIDQLVLPLITLIALVIFYLLGWRIEALSFSAIAGFACSALIGLIVFSKFVKRFTLDAAPRYTTRIWLGFALPLLFSGLITQIAGTVDILFLSIFVTSVQAGIYIAANRIGNILNIPLYALTTISIPLMTEYYAQGKHEQLESMFKLATKWSVSISLPICLCCLVFHDAILGIFGPRYTTGWLVLIIICLGNLVNPGTGPALELLTITRRLRIISINSIISVILNVGLCFLLVPRFNILGVALAGGLESIILGALYLTQIYWILKMHPYRWDVCKPLLAGGMASLVGILLQHFVHFQPGLGPFTVVAELSLIIPFILVYILMMILLGFSREDQIVFHAVLARFGWQRSTKGV